MNAVYVVGFLSNQLMAGARFPVSPTFYFKTVESAIDYIKKQSKSFIVPLQYIQDLNGKKSKEYYCEIEVDGNVMRRWWYITQIDLWFDN